MPYSRTSCSDRLHGLDALRGVALLLGVALHAAMPWLPGAQYFWITSETASTPALNVLFWWIHSFRMTLFFLLAGYFGRLLYERKGASGFVHDRWRRIGRVLLIGWPLAFAAIVAVAIWGAWLKGGGTLPSEPPPGPKLTAANFPLTHLWFLYILLWFYTVVLMLRLLSSRLDPNGRLGLAVDKVMRGALGPWAVPLLALPATAGLMALSDWYVWFGIPTPDQGLYPNPTAALAFGTAFCVGWLLQRRIELLSRVSDQMWLNLVLATVASGVCLAQTGIEPELAIAPRNGATLVYAYFYAMAGWGWTLGLIGFVLRYASGHSSTWRYVADASYWVYLVHLPIVMVLHVAATQAPDMPWWFKYPALIAVVLLITFGSYHWIVRGTLLGAWLEGRKLSPASKPAPTTTSSTE